MKFRCVLLGSLAALTFAGCAGGRVVEGLNGRYGRTYSVEEDGNHAQVNEVWQFSGTTASSHATWSGFAHGGQYTTVVDQGWDVKYCGRGVFRLSEKGRNLTGPPLAVLEDSYDLELDGSEVRVDGGPSDAPLHRVSGTSAPAAERPAPAKPTPAKTKKKR